METMSAPSIPADAGRSWWLHDALAADPVSPRRRSASDTTADVVVLGGGYTGMWTALVPEGSGAGTGHRPAGTGHLRGRPQRAQRRVRQQLVERARRVVPPVR